MKYQKVIDFINKNLGLILFLVFLLIGFINTSNYGISWDEAMQRETGLHNYNYVFKNDNTLLNWNDKDYGPFFELILVSIEKMFNKTEVRDIYIFRHFFTHLFFLISALFLFKLIKLNTKNNILSTIGFLFLILSPRLYAHSFFNSKDIPFLSMLIICLYFFQKLQNNKKLKNYIYLGITTGLLIDIRIMGVLFLVCVFVFEIFDFFYSHFKNKNYKYLLYLLTYLFSTIVVVYIFWPYLWRNPASNFITAFENMSKFRWEGSVLFFGKFIKANTNPMYAPTWFAITIPILYLLFGFLGIFTLIYKLIRKPLLSINNPENRLFLISFALFVLPVLSVIILKSTLYDGWRQLYFIYPSFVILAILTIQLIIKYKILKKVLLVVILLNFVFIIYEMIKIHPHQQVYFNNFMDRKTSEKIRKNIEFDYWGASYKEALEYILKHDNSPNITINGENWPANLNGYMIKEHERTRIKFVDRYNAMYFITNYRWHPQDYLEYKNYHYYSKKIYNSSVYTIFKFN